MNGTGLLQKFQCHPAVILQDGFTNGTSWLRYGCAANRALEFFTLVMQA